MLLQPLHSASVTVTEASAGARMATVEYGALKPKDLRFRYWRFAIPSTRIIHRS